MRNDQTSAALSRLPHGEEFRFVTKLLELEPGERGKGEYWLRGDEPFLKGHFPGNPIMPGVLLVEAAAQLAGVVAQSDPSTPPLADLKLTAIRQLKIFGTCLPGDHIQLEAKVTGRMGGLIQARVQVSRSDVPLLNGELTLSGTPATEA